MMWSSDYFNFFQRNNRLTLHHLLTCLCLHNYSITLNLSKIRCMCMNESPSELINLFHLSIFLLISVSHSVNYCILIINLVIMWSLPSHFFILLKIFLFIIVHFIFQMKFIICFSISYIFLILFFCIFYSFACLDFILNIFFWFIFQFTNSPFCL